MAWAVLPHGPHLRATTFEASETCWDVIGRDGLREGGQADQHDRQQRIAHFPAASGLIPPKMEETPFAGADCDGLG